MADADIARRDVLCSICGAHAQLLNDRHPGYKLPDVFSIYACRYCDLQFAWPLRSDPAVYEAIYRQADDIPGYDRYEAYAREIGAQARPLDWLAGREDAYWFIREALRQRGIGKGDRVLEIGSGLGYLTYAMAKAGYDARGLEISAAAVADARRRFGDLYDCADAVVLAEQRPGSAHAVVMTEVIEHLPEPDTIMRAIRRVLRDDGVALITTPNKSSHGAHAYWRTDNPPVHLWWLSEAAMRRLAQKAGMAVEFFDFTDFHRARLPFLGEFPPSDLEAREPPFLGEDLTPIAVRRPGAPIEKGLKRLRDALLPAIKRAKLASRYRRDAVRLAAERSAAMGMIATIAHDAPSLASHALAAP